ncbi:MAG: MFS transporter [Phycisphaerales bacterium]
MGSLWHGDTAIERLLKLVTNRNLMLMSVASLLTDIASEMTYPLLPLLVVGTLGASKSFFGLIEGVAEAVAQLLRVGAGRLSDRLGKRKPLTIGGYLLGVAGKLVLWLAAVPALALVGRVVDRLGKALRSPARDALIAESVDSSERARAFGFHRAMDTAGAFIGVAAAWVIMRQGTQEVRPVFLWAALPAGLAVIVLLFVRETGKGRKKPAAGAADTASWGYVWRTVPAELKRYLLIVFLFNVGNCSNQFLLLRAQDRGFAPTDVILAYAVYNLAYTILAYPAGAIADAIGHKRVLIAGYAVHGLAYAGFAAAGFAGPWAIWVLFALYGAHMALTEGVEKALIVDLAPAEHRATVLGMFSTVVGLALLPASAMAGVLWDRVGAATPFAVGAVLGIGAAVALVWALRGRGRSAHS